jgi:hypothetical protein
VHHTSKQVNLQNYEFNDLGRKQVSVNLVVSVGSPHRKRRKVGFARDVERKLMIQFADGSKDDKIPYHLHDPSELSSVSLIGFQ